MTRTTATTALALPVRSSRRRKLTRDGILIAAIKVLDQEGFGSLTMRRLGQELDVDAMSLYTHFENKDALLSAISSHLFAQIEGADLGPGTWREEMRAVMVSTYKLAARHPSFVEVLFKGPAEPVQTRGQRDVDVLVAGGFSPAAARAALTALVSYVVGYLHHTANIPTWSKRATLLVTSDIDFQFGLDALLDGLALQNPQRR